MHYSDADKFVRNRTETYAITKQRVHYILSYVLECYRLLKSNDQTYSAKEIRSQTKIKPEDYLRTRFVNDYLRKQLHLLKPFKMDEVFFGKEQIEEYYDHSGVEQEDKIDIYVRDAALKNYWGAGEEVYFAIECKRVQTLSDTQKYVLDIAKFANRNHTHTRLPFEGQVAFIESINIIHSQVAENVNVRLSQTTTIETIKPLAPLKLHSTVDCTYLSEHKKATGKKEPFHIYHLLLDYSTVVVD